MVELLGEKNIGINSALGHGTSISFIINDKYSPDADSQCSIPSIREFAEESIRPAVYLKMEQRETLFIPSIRENVDLNQRESMRMIPAPRTPDRRTTDLVSKETFILLDDSELNLQLLKKCLQKLKPNCDTREFTSPEPLIQLLDSEDFSGSTIVFFLDIELSSSLTGMEVAQLIHEKKKSGVGWSQFFIISYSSHSKKAIRKQSKGFHGFLSKPFRVGELKELLTKTLVLKIR